jgi:hypothetical protein
MLLAGLGWGNMPAHLVEDEIKDGRLAVIQTAGFDSVTALVLGAASFDDSERRRARRQTEGQYRELRNCRLRQDRPRYRQGVCPQAA